MATAAATLALVLLPSLQAQAQPTFVVSTTADPVGGTCAGGTAACGSALPPRPQWRGA
ncbi:MAG: hypothetical protein M3256_18405 [Actinomycetota bacterium]|nr:hypothetical protein [Actinomycetota bacterium]